MQRIWRHSRSVWTAFWAFRTSWALHEWLSWLIHWLQFTGGGSSIQVFFCLIYCQSISSWSRLNYNQTEMRMSRQGFAWFNNILALHLVLVCAWTHKEGQAQAVCSIRSGTAPAVLTSQNPQGVSTSHQAQTATAPAVGARKMAWSWKSDIELRPFCLSCLTGCLIPEAEMLTC